MKNKLLFSLGFASLVFVASSCNPNAKTPFVEDEPTEQQDQSTDVEKVEKLINKIGNPITSNDFESISKASIEYNKLSLDKQHTVSNREVLRKAQREYGILSDFRKVDFDDDNIVLTFGAVSDIHNSKDIPTGLSYLANYKTGMDALVISGDITDGVRYYGTEDYEIDQLRPKIVDNIDEDTDIVLALGNHDSTNASKTQVFYDKLGDRFFSKVENVDDFIQHGCSHTVLKGYHFLCLECDYDKNDSLSDFSMQYLKNELEEITTSPTYNNEYIFVVVHATPANCLPTINSGNSNINNVLRDYPQVFTISGHWHKDLYDSLNFNQDYYTSLNPGQLHFTDAKERDYIMTKVLQDAGNGVLTSQYGEYAGQNLATGCYIEIDKNGSVRINRLDFVHESKNGRHEIGEPLVVAKPDYMNQHLCSYPSERTDHHNLAPYFDNNAYVTPFVFNGGERSYNLEVNFDQAKDDDGFVYNYKVDLYDWFQPNPYLSYDVLSEAFLHPDVSEMSKTLSFKINSLTTVPAKIRITPYDNVGLAGSYIEQRVKQECESNFAEKFTNPNEQVATFVAKNGVQTKQTGKFTKLYTTDTYSKEYATDYTVGDKMVSTSPIKLNGATFSLVCDGLDPTQYARDFFGFALAPAVDSSLIGNFNATMWTNAWGTSPSTQNRLSISSDHYMAGYSNCKTIGYIDEALTSKGIYSSTNEYVFDGKSTAGASLSFTYLPESGNWKIDVTDAVGELPNGVSINSTMWSSCKRTIYVPHDKIIGVDGTSGVDTKVYMICYGAVNTSSGRSYDIDPSFSYRQSLPFSNNAAGYSSFSFDGDITSKVASSRSYNPNGLKVNFLTNSNRNDSNCFIGFSLVKDRKDNIFDGNHFNGIFTPGKEINQSYISTLSLENGCDGNLIAYEDEALSRKANLYEFTASPSLEYSLEFNHLGITERSESKDIYKVTLNATRNDGNVDSICYYLNSNLIPEDNVYVVLYSSIGTNSTAVLLEGSYNIQSR